MWKSLKNSKFSNKLLLIRTWSSSVRLFYSEWHSVVFCIVLLEKKSCLFMGVYQLGRSVTKTLLFLTFYRAFVQNFDRAFEKKRCRAFVSFLQGSRIDFDRVFVSILTGSSYRFYKVHLSVLQGFRINFDRAFVPLLQDHRNVKAVSVISSHDTADRVCIEISILSKL